MGIWTVISMIGVGAVCTSLGWFISRLRSQQERDHQRIAAETELATLRERLQSRDMQLMQREKEAVVAERDHSELTELRVRYEEQARIISEKDNTLRMIEQKFSDTFKALSAEALQSSNRSFIDLAQNVLGKYIDAANHSMEKKEMALAEMIQPIRESLSKFDHKIHDLEKARIGAYEGLSQQVRSLLETQKQLRGETANLVKALRTPGVRGRWGEIQLRRVVEMAGMLNHCDFYEQQTSNSELGLRRPDVIVRLPGGKNVVVDAKVPLHAYLEALDTTDEELRLVKMRDHAAQVKRHIQQLSQKAYWDQFQPAPEFVVLFLPGETFFSAALEYDPSLIEAGVAQRVILATPTTLIALLKAVAFGWRQESLEKNAKEISDLGRDMYRRIASMGGHLADMGRSLGTAVNCYNKAAASMESRVLVTARKFRDLEAGDEDKDIEVLGGIETIPRDLQAPELLGGEPESTL